MLWRVAFPKPPSRHRVLRISKGRMGTGTAGRSPALPTETLDVDTDLTTMRDALVQARSRLDPVSRNC